MKFLQLCPSEDSSFTQRNAIKFSEYMVASWPQENCNQREWKRDLHCRRSITSTSLNLRNDAVNGLKAMMNLYRLHAGGV